MGIFLFFEALLYLSAYNMIRLPCWRVIFQESIPTIVDWKTLLSPDWSERWLIHQITFQHFFLSSFVFVSFSPVIVSKSSKGRPVAARRSTVDDKSTLMTCIENGEFPKGAKVSSGEHNCICPLIQQPVSSDEFAWNSMAGFAFQL